MELEYLALKKERKTSVEKHKTAGYYHTGQPKKWIVRMSLANIVISWWNRNALSFCQKVNRDIVVMILSVMGKVPSPNMECQTIASRDAECILCLRWRLDANVNSLDI